MVHPIRTSAAAVRIDGVAMAWGGLVASIGLMVAAERARAGLLLATALSFGLGGFLAGVRAEARRPTHGAAAALAGHALYLVFAAAARLIDALGGPDAPPLLPGSTRDWLLTVGWSAVLATAGGAVAGTWLRPAGRQRMR